MSEGSTCDNCRGPVLATQEPEEDGSLYCEICRTRLRMQAAETAPSINAAGESLGATTASNEMFSTPEVRQLAKALSDVKAECESWERATDEDFAALLADLEIQETMGRAMSEDFLQKMGGRARIRLVILDSEIARLSKELAELRSDHAQLDLALDKAMADHERDTSDLERKLQTAETTLALWTPLVDAAMELISDSDHPDHRHIAISEVEEMASRIVEARMEEVK